MKPFGKAIYAVKKEADARIGQIYKRLLSVLIGSHLSLVTT